MKKLPAVAVVERAEEAARLARLGVEANVALVEVAGAVKDGPLEPDRRQPARSAHRAALQVARARPPRNLGPPLLPLRHPHPDVGGRRPGRGRPRPGQLHRRPAHRSPLDLPGARFFLLRALSADRDTSSPSSYGASTRPGPPDPTRGSSIKWHVKRAHHRSWPHPTRPPRITILGAPSPSLNGIATTPGGLSWRNTAGERRR
jgi:hypothetical protein